MGMKICYIWIEKFRNFENLGLNLSSSTKFLFDPDKNNLTKKNIEPLPNDFFGQSITDVVGLIGKNGSGKSNAIELVCKILKGSKSSLPTNFFLIIENDETFVCHYSFPNREHPNTDFEIEFEEYNSNINPLKVVFFSNVFDDRRNDFGGDVSDISVNNLFNRPSLYRKDKVTDFEKQINLINSKIFQTLNIEIPTKVQLISKIWAPRFNLNMERGIYQENYEIIKEFKKLFRDRIRDIKAENKFIHLLRFGFFFEIFNNYSRRSRLSSNEPKFIFENISNFLTELENTRSTEEITENLINYLDHEVSKSTLEQMSLFMETESESRIDEKSKKIKSQIEFIKNIKHSTSNMSIEYNAEGARNRSLEYFTFNYEKKPSKEFINDFIRLFSDTTIFDINWLGISSGHKAYLNLFSSLYQELRKTKHENLLLCIDEGDLYLHPKWQIEFFDKLLSVMPSIYSGKAQLVLTSHSPFLLSDLPNQNITILDKDYPGSTLNGVDLKVKTFGGNLYDLYSEPFFLGNSRTSDFAYNKIKTLIETVEKKDITSNTKKDLLKLTNLLGDEIIQFKIKKLLEND